MPIKLRKRHTSKTAPASAPTAPEYPEELLTIREAMAFAKVADATVRRWIKSKQLRAHKAGGQVRIDRADLVRFLQPWSPKKACEYPK